MKSKKEVQIKSSFSFRSYFPTGDVPAHIICIQILSDGSFKELFNGTGEFLKAHYVLKRNLTNGSKKQLYTLSGNILKELNEQFKALHPKGRVEALEK